MRHFLFTASIAVAISCGISSSWAQEPAPISANDVVEKGMALPSYVEYDDAYIQGIANKAADMLGKTPGYINHFLVVIDRAVSKQAIFIFYVSPDGAWNLSYAGHVSTGKPGRKEHFKTPTGVFEHSGDILGYRAEGTFNANHIRGIGLKGMRVWDFGWQETEDWRTKGASTKIRMEMHATDPANLEKRMGKPDSEGCIRIHADANTFIDQNGILDEVGNQYALQGDRRWSSLFGKNHTYLPEAGRYVIVVDTDT